MSVGRKRTQVSGETVLTFQGQKRISWTWRQQICRKFRCIGVELQGVLSQKTVVVLYVSRDKAGEPWLKLINLETAYNYKKPFFFLPSSGLNHFNFSTRNLETCRSIANSTTSIYVVPKCLSQSCVMMSEKCRTLRTWRHFLCQFTQRPDRHAQLLIAFYFMVRPHFGIKPLKRGFPFIKI